LFFPFFAFFFATIRAGQGMKLLGIRDLELVIFLFTFKCDFCVVKSIHDSDAVLGRYLFTGIVELLALIAPIKVSSITNDLSRGSGVLNTLGGNLGAMDRFNVFNWDKECMVVKAFKLEGVFAFTNGEGLRNTFTFELLSYELSFLKYLGFVLNLSGFSLLLLSYLGS
jgi:hypothetical protein